MKKFARIITIVAVVLVALSFLALVSVTILQKPFFNIPAKYKMVVPFGPLAAALVLLVCTVILLIRMKRDTCSINTEVILLICMVVAVPVLYGVGNWLTYWSFDSTPTLDRFLDYMNGSSGTFWNGLLDRFELFFIPAKLGLALACAACGLNIGFHLQNAGNKKHIRVFSVTALVMTILSFLMLVFSVLFQKQVFNAFYSFINYGDFSHEFSLLKYWGVNRWIVSWPSLAVCLIQIICFVLLLVQAKRDKGGYGGDIAMLAIFILAIPIVASLENNFGYLSRVKDLGKAYKNLGFWGVYDSYLYWTHYLGNNTGRWVNDIPRICMIPALVAQMVGCAACGISLVARKAQKVEAPAVEETAPEEESV